jgi:hypothetical protein
MPLRTRKRIPERAGRRHRPSGPCDSAILSLLAGLMLAADKTI